MERKSAEIRLTEAVGAAQRIIERDGVAAVSVRNVATEASMSVGSLRHIFPQHEDLLVAVMSHTVEAARKNVQAVLEQAEKEKWETQKLVLALLAEVLPFEAQTRTDFLAQLAILLANPDNPGIVAARREVSVGLDQLCGRIVELVGAGVGKKKEQERKATRLRLLIDGLALNLLEGREWSREDVNQMLIDELYAMPPVRKK